MQNIVDIINDLEKENKLIDISNKCSAFTREANNITKALDTMLNSHDNQRFRLEYCSLSNANNNVYYYRFSIFSLETVYTYQRRLDELNNNQRKFFSCSPDAIFCIRESDLSERENNILKVIAQPEEYFKENIEAFNAQDKHLKLFEYMEYMMALSLVKCLEKAELAKVEINNLKNEIYRKKV